MNNILSAIGLGGGITGGAWDGLDTTTMPGTDVAGGNPLTNSAPAAASAGTSGFWGGLGGDVTGLLNFAKSAAPVAQAGLNLANQASNTAANNTGSATGVLAQPATSFLSSPLIWIGALVLGGLGLMLLLKE